MSNIKTIVIPELITDLSPKEYFIEIENNVEPVEYRYVDRSLNPDGDIRGWQISIDGGWGYTKETAVIENKGKFGSRTIESVFIKERSYVELSDLNIEPISDCDNYSFNATNVKETIIQDEYKTYKKLNFEFNVIKNDQLLMVKKDCWFDITYVGYTPFLHKDNEPINWKRSVFILFGVYIFLVLVELFF